VPPVAVGFFADPPPGLPRWEGGPQPSGCSFWRQAQEGDAFYTAPADHYGCAVGAYTHHIDLPPDRAGELGATIARMTGAGYIEADEVAGIPRLANSPAVVAYGPVDAVDFPPAAVLVSAKPAQAMLLYEAAVRAGAGNMVTTVLGRPGCAVLPYTLDTKEAALSFGCTGSRLYTGTPDDEIYVSIPGDAWEAVVDRLMEIKQANSVMAQFYESRRHNPLSG
jgi:uncharacterized protein (DUF169 family)